MPLDGGLTTELTLYVTHKCLPALTAQFLKGLAARLDPTLDLFTICLILSYLLHHVRENP